MLNQYHLPRTPAWARRLRALERVGALTVTQEIRSFAKQGLHDGSGLPQGLQLGDSAQQAFQHVLDWQHRCVVVDDNTRQARDVALASAHELNEGSVVVITQAQHFADWRARIKTYWPQARLVVTTDSASTCETITDQHDWIVTDYSTFVDSGIMRQRRPNMMILEILDQRSTTPAYGYSEALTGAIREIPHVVALHHASLLNLNMATGHQTVNTGHGLEWSVRDTLALVGHSWRLIEAAGINLSARQYLTKRGIRVNDVNQLLPLVGVAPHLVAHSIKSQILEYHDPLFVISHAHAHSEMRRESKLVASYETHTDSLLKQHGVAIEQLVQQALQGDTASRDSLKAMNNPAWGRLKQAAVGRVMDRLNTPGSKNVIVAQEPNLVRFAALSASAVVVGSQDVSPVARYLYPAASWKRHRESASAPNPRNSIIVDSLLNLPTDALEVTNFVYLAELPVDPEEFQRCVRLADLYGFKLVINVFRNTHDAELYRALKQTI